MTAAIGAAAIAGGGGAGTELGAGCVLVWLLIAALAVSGRMSPAGLTVPLAVLIGLFALLAAWTAASSGWADDDGAAFTDLVRALLYLGVVLLVALSARPGSAPSWLAGIGAGGALVAAVAIVSRVLGLDADRDIALELPLAAERLSYPLGYWNALGYLMAMTLPALAWLAGAAPLRLARLAAAASVPVVAALFLTSSRGAFLAAILGLLLVAFLAANRARMIGVALATLPAWLVVIVGAAVLRGDLVAGAGITGSGLVLGGIVLLAAAASWFALAHLAPSGGRRVARLPRPGRLPAVVGLAIVGVLVAVIGPSSFLGEFRTEGAVGEREATAALVSGSGRSSFWGTALEAFADEPVGGIGAGGYRNYWNNNGDLQTPVTNAHSAPLETLAELGLVGGLALLGALVVPLIGAWRLWSSAPPELRDTLAAALAIFVAGFIAIAIDWTWALPAAIAPMLIAMVLLSGAALRQRGWGGSFLVDPRIAGYEPSEGPPFARPWAIGVGAGLAGIAAVWVGGVLALSSIQMDRSVERLAEGDLQGAAEAARAAEAIQPWSPEPALQLAEIESVAANYRAAKLRAEQVVQASPSDFRPWLVLADAERALGNRDLAFRYFLRATLLAPEVLLRGLRSEVRSGFR